MQLPPSSRLHQAVEALSCCRLKHSTCTAYRYVRIFGTGWYAASSPRPAGSQNEETQLASLQGVRGVLSWCGCENAPAAEASRAASKHTVCSTNCLAGVRRQLVLTLKALVTCSATRFESVVLGLFSPHYPYPLLICGVLCPPNVPLTSVHQSPTGTKFLLMVEPQCPQVTALLAR